MILYKNIKITPQNIFIPIINNYSIVSSTNQPIMATTDSYENVSTGFELESQHLCLAYRKDLDLLLPQELRKHTFVQHSIEVYNDKLTPSTRFVKETIDPFLASSPETSIAVPFSDGSRKVWNLKAPWTFNNQEFVVTLTRKRSVPVRHVVEFLFQQFLSALDKVAHVLEKYDLLDIPYENFPYRSVLVPRTIRDPRYGGVAFLARDTVENFSVEDQSFFYQCTIGFLLKDAIPILCELAEAYYRAKEKDNELLPLARKARSLRKGNERLQGYLFLFLLSASTRTVRKSGAVFTLRHAFQDLRNAITAEEIDILEEWLLRSSDEFEYFHGLHHDPVPKNQQQKYTRQSLWDVGRIPYRASEDRVFVEYRGFQAVLTHRVGSGPKSIKRIRNALQAPPPQGA